MLFSYIGPETMMPVASIIAAVAGVFMMFGRNVMGFCRGIVRRIFSHVPTEACAQRVPERGNRSLANPRGLAAEKSRKLRPRFNTSIRVSG